MRASAEVADIIIFGGPWMRMAAAQLLCWDLVFCPFPSGWHMFVCMNRQTGLARLDQIARRKKIYVGESSSGSLP